MKKVLFWIIAVIVVIAAGFIIYVNLGWTKSYDVPTPEISAINDSALISRGKYLAYGPAHCATCHVPIDQVMAVENGAEVPLSGGWEISIGPGIFRAPNLTPDEETGIGLLTDGQIARAMRYSVSHDGKYLAPFMPFQELSDSDVQAIISFLRSQKPVHNEVKRSEVNFLGKALLATGMLKPEGPGNTPAKTIAVDSTVEYGSYIANSVANCMGCHTERDLKTGAMVGEPFAGGMHFEPDAFTKGYAFVSPNITPDMETGIMSRWNETTFISRFRSGRVYQGSPMPWGSYSRMTDIELKALFKYIQSLEPVKNNIEQVVIPPENI